MKRVYLPIYFLIFIVLFFPINNSCKSPNERSSSENLEIKKLYDSIEFKMDVIKEPKFPNYSVSIVDYGAVGDGLTMNTEAINKSIEDVNKKGGGKVIIPAGIWLTGPIKLRSNVNLYLEEGALIVFSRNFDDYPLIKTSFEGLNTYRCISPIYAYKEKNIAITGKGIIDGSGDAWRPVKKSKLTESQWKKLIASGGVVDEKNGIWYPSEKSLKGASISNMNVPINLKTIEEHEEIKDFLRPVMVSFVECKNVLLEGVTFQNSPAWNLHPLMCENIILRNLIIRNPWYSQNGDGLDLESCKNVLIYNCNFDVGDDAICIKSGKDADGRKRNKPTENVIIKNCIVYHGHGGFVVGSEMSGGVRNIHVSNCTFIGTDAGLRFKTTRGRGGVVEKIYISNIRMVNIETEPIRFNMYYGGEAPEAGDGKKITREEIKKLPVTEETPQFREIYMKNIYSIGSYRALALRGLPEMNIKKIYIENTILKAKNGIEIFEADSIAFKNVKVIVEDTIRPLMYCYNMKNVEFDGFKLEYKNQKPLIVFEGEEIFNISFKKEDFGNLGKMINFKDGKLENIIKIK